MDHVDYQIEDEALASRARKPLLAQLTAATDQSGLSPFRMILQWLPTLFGPGKLDFQGYLDHRLFEPHHDRASRRRFLRAALHWPLTNACADPAWRERSEDKWQMYAQLDGLPVPRTLAVIDASERDYGDTPRLGSEAELRAFLEACDEPLFLKPVLGIQSLGVMWVAGLEGDRVRLVGAPDRPLQALGRQLLSRGATLVQRVVSNHPAMADWAPRLATVRFYNFVQPDGLRVGAAVLKIPAAHNIADNFWREGNRLAALDPATGTIRRAIEGRGVDLRLHPELVGITLPAWEEVCALNAACAERFAPLAYHSTDLGITADGPVVIEVNIGGSFELPQLASGEGFLTPANRAFFEAHGYRF